jgi:TRAP-type mannitol/chloroaromatic compound transport system permease large subunit
MVPFMLIQLGAVLLLATFPQIGLWLPSLFYK